MHYKEIKYGFEYGSAEVVRNCSDEKLGWVDIGIRTKKQSIDVYVTKGGKIRVYKDGEELVGKAKVK